MVVACKSRCSFVDVQQQLVVKLLAAAGLQGQDAARAALQQHLRAVQPVCAVRLVTGALLQGWLPADAAAAAAVTAFEETSRPRMQHVLVTAAAAVREW
jgi:predicted DCC family thiol-disulfide oxidoreductase YuxK